MINKQVFQHMDFCRRLPQFTKLPHNDQMYLLKQSLNELLILNIAYMSIQVSFITTMRVGYLMSRFLSPVDWYTHDLPLTTPNPTPAYTPWSVYNVPGVYPMNTLLSILISRTCRDLYIENLGSS